jgi:hypothetical protein
MDEGLLIYIDSLEQGEAKTRDEWIEIIRQEENDLANQDERFIRLSENEIKVILDTLETDGYIKH